MPDVVDKQTRSRMMSGIKGKNTKPEMLIRRALHARGFRYQLHRKNLPGKPDLVFPRYRAVIFVHGCFWHAHGCHLFKWPKSRQEFWRAKLQRNVEVDSLAMAQLQSTGWRIMVIWECALKGKTRLPEGDVIDAASNWLLSSLPTGLIEGAVDDSTR